jgi:hypothetical protein
VPVRCGCAPARWPADAHFEPHRHAWAQIAYCASGIVQVSAADGGSATGEVTYIVPPSRAVWIAPRAPALGALIDGRALPHPVHRRFGGAAGLERLPGAGGLAAAAPSWCPRWTKPGLPRARESLLTALLLDETARGRHPGAGRAAAAGADGGQAPAGLCEAVLRAPAERRRWRNGRRTSVPASAPWRACSASSWA